MLINRYICPNQIEYVMEKTLMTLVAALSCTAISATNLKVVNLSQEEASFELSKVQFIDFRGTDDLKIVGKDGSTLNTTAYDQIRRIDFKGSLSNTPTSVADNIKVYPNPTQDLLVISGTEKECNIQVIDMQGKSVYNAKASGKSVEIPVTNLSNGTYLLKVGNKVVKFIKD